MEKVRDRVLLENQKRADAGIKKSLSLGKEYEQLKSLELARMIKALKIEKDRAGIDKNRISSIDGAIKGLTEEKTKLDEITAAKGRTEKAAPVLGLLGKAGVDTGGLEKVIGGVGKAGIAIAGAGIAIGFLAKMMKETSADTTKWRGSVNAANLALGKNYDSQVKMSRVHLMMGPIIKKTGANSDELLKSMSGLSNSGIDPIEEGVGTLTKNLVTLTRGYQLSDQQIQATTKVLHQELGMKWKDAMGTMVNMTTMMEELSITEDERVRIQTDALKSGIDYNIGVKAIGKAWKESSKDGRGLSRALRMFEERAFGAAKAPVEERAHLGRALGYSQDPMEAAAMVGAGGKGDMWGEAIEKYSKQWGLGGVEGLKMPKGLEKGSAEWMKKAGEIEKFTLKLGGMYSFMDEQTIKDELGLIQVDKVETKEGAIVSEKEKVEGARRVKAAKEAQGVGKDIADFGQGLKSGFKASLAGIAEFVDGVDKSTDRLLGITKEMESRKTRQVLEVVGP